MRVRERECFLHATTFTWKFNFSPSYWVRLCRDDCAPVEEAVLCIQNHSCNSQSNVSGELLRSLTLLTIARVTCDSQKLSPFTWCVSQPVKSECARETTVNSDDFFHWQASPVDRWQRRREKERASDTSTHTQKRLRKRRVRKVINFCTHDTITIALWKAKSYALLNVNETARERERERTRVLECWVCWDAHKRHLFLRKKRSPTVRTQ